MSKAVNIIVRTTLVLMIIGATFNVVGEIMLARGGPFPPASSLWLWGLRGALIAGAVGIFIGTLIALIIGAFKRYTDTQREG